MSCNENRQGCRKPESLKGKPQDCSAEQVLKCHGGAEAHLCVETADCEHPERLKGKPGDCASEQVRQCHGDTADHACVGNR